MPVEAIVMKKHFLTLFLPEPRQNAEAILSFPHQVIKSR
jgi:hypothetical protein